MNFLASARGGDGNGVTGVSSYGPVAQEEGNDLEAHLHTGAQEASYDLTEAPRTSMYASEIPQVQGFTWRDSYYDGKHGIVAVFDRYGHEAGRWVQWKFLRLAGVLWLISLVYWILGMSDLTQNVEESIVDDICGTYMLIFGGLFAVMGWRSRQAMEAQHIALTMEGVRIDNGSMLSITVAYDQIAKIAVLPYIICGQRSPQIMVVRIHRNASPLETFGFSKYKQMELYGIVHAEKFKELVLAMKESYSSTASTQTTLGRVELQELS